MRRLALLTGSAALALSAVQPALAEDDPRTVPVFDATHAAAAILGAAKVKGKALTIVLRNGATYSGKVKSVGDNAVVLTGLRGKEFFDAWVRIDAIAAMEERVRLR